MPPAWTILVYMAADNNLESYANQSLQSMKQVAKLTKANVLVQLDTSAGARRYRVRAGQIDDLGVPAAGGNTGDPKGLTDFLNAGANYHAQHYALILWGHGFGWEDPYLPVIRATPRSRGRWSFRIPWTDFTILLDDGSSDDLSPPELRSAIEKSDLPKLDLLGCDACLMSMVEVAYELRERTPLLVASETITPPESWPYGAILDAIENESGATTPAWLAEQIVLQFEASKPRFGTLAALDLTRMAQLATKLDALAGALLAGPRAPIATARSATISLYNPRYVDCASMLEALRMHVPGAQTAAQAALTALQACFVARMYTATDDNKCGISLFFPNLPEPSKRLEQYDELQFSRDTRWPAFVRGYLEGATLPARWPALGVGDLLRNVGNGTRNLFFNRPS